MKYPRAHLGSPHDPPHLGRAEPNVPGDCPVAPPVPAHPGDPPVPLQHLPLPGQRPQPGAPPLLLGVPPPRAGRPKDGLSQVNLLTLRAVFSTSASERGAAYWSLQRRRSPARAGGAASGPVPVGGAEEWASRSPSGPGTWLPGRWRGRVGAAGHGPVETGWRAGPRPHRVQEHRGPARSCRVLGDSTHRCLRSGGTRSAGGRGIVHKCRFKHESPAPRYASVRSRWGVGFVDWGARRLAPG